MRILLLRVLILLLNSLRLLLEIGFPQVYQSRIPVQWDLHLFKAIHHFFAWVNTDQHTDSSRVIRKALDIPVDYHRVETIEDLAYSTWLKTALGKGEVFR